MRPALRDPAWVARVAWALAGLLVLWPMVVLTEFRPWSLLEPGAMKPALNFLGSFFPPRTDAEFMRLLLRETWRTVAMARSGPAVARRRGNRQDQDQRPVPDNRTDSCHPARPIDAYVCGTATPLGRR